MAGTRPAWAAASADRGIAAASATVNGRIWLTGRDPVGLARFDRQVSTPGSPEYGHYLSPAQFRARFGPAPGQVRAVESWARSSGLTVTAATPHYLAVRGTVAQAQRAFSVRFHRYLVGGRLLTAPDADVQVPAAVGADVAAVTGLAPALHLVHPADSLPPPPQNRWTPGPCDSYYHQSTASLPSAYGSTEPWNVCGYTPDQLRSAYGAAKSGLTGKRVTVAIVDAYASPTLLSDANTYFASHGDAGFAAGQFSENLPSSWNSVDACGGSGWYTEQSIDVEAMHAIAPAANVVYVGAASCNDDDLEDALARIVDNKLATIVSNSWGAEEDQETANEPAYDSIFQQGIAEGIGFYFAPGDDGYGDPNTAIGAAYGSDKLQTGYPASSPYVTGVSGTALGIGATGNYEFEFDYGVFRDKVNAAGTGWTDPLPGSYPADFYEGGTGGTSYDYSQPSYQAGTVPDSLSRTLPDGAASSTPMRVTPDVSMDGDPDTGMIIGLTAQQPDGSDAYSTARWGGTSLSTPLFAGMQALAQQAQGTAIGFANPEIYQRYNEALFTDIRADPRGRPLDFGVNWYTHPYTATGPVLTYLATSGIDGAGPALLAAAPGYDDATGVGAPNYAYLESFK